MKCLRVVEKLQRIRKIFFKSSYSICYNFSIKLIEMKKFTTHITLTALTLATLLKIVSKPWDSEHASMLLMNDKELNQLTTTQQENLMKFAVINRGAIENEIKNIQNSTLGIQQFSMQFDGDNILVVEQQMLPQLVDITNLGVFSTNKPKEQVVNRSFFEISLPQDRVVRFIQMIKQMSGSNHFDEEIINLQNLEGYSKSCGIIKTTFQQLNGDATIRYGIVCQTQQGMYGIDFENSFFSARYIYTDNTGTPHLETFYLNGENTILIGTFNEFWDIAKEYNSEVEKESEVELSSGINPN